MRPDRDPGQLGAGAQRQGRGYHSHQEYVQGVWLAERQRDDLGGLLGCIPALPPRSVHHQCEQGEAGDPHRTELPVFEHGIHPGGGVPSPGSARRLGSQPGGGRAELAHQADRGSLLQFLRQQDLPAGILSAADEPLGHSALSQKPGASAGRDPAQKSAHDRRTDLPAGAGRQGKTDFEELLSGAANRGRGQPLSLRRSDGLFKLSAGDASAEETEQGVL